MPSLRPRIPLADMIPAFSLASRERSARRNPAERRIGCAAWSCASPGAGAAFADVGWRTCSTTLLENGAYGGGDGRLASPERLQAGGRRCQSVAPGLGFSRSRVRFQAFSTRISGFGVARWPHEWRRAAGGRRARPLPWPTTALPPERQRVRARQASFLHAGPRDTPCVPDRRPNVGDPWLFRPIGGKSACGARRTLGPWRQ